MYKSLIVDDEKNIRDRLVTFFPWDELGFGVVKMAENGEEALTIINKEVPDVLLTDIMMPKMTGLELVEKIKQSYPQIKIVILSAYDDFEYAQQAIKFGVKGYLLKPLLKKEFTEVMNKLVMELKEEKKVAGHDEQMLLDLTEGKDVEKYKDILKYDYNRIVICCLNEILKEYATFTFRQSLKEKITSYFNQQEIPILFYKNSLILLIFKHKPISKYDIQPIVQQFLVFVERLLIDMEIILKPVYIGVGNLAKGLEQINKSYKEAIYACSYKYFNPNKYIIFYQDLKPSAHNLVKQEKDSFDDKIQNCVGNLVESILTKETLKITTIVNQYTDLIIHYKGENVVKIKKESYKLIMMVSLKLKEEGYTITSIDEEHVLQKIYQLQSLQELKKWLRHVLQLFAVDIVKHNEKYNNRYVTVAKNYVKNHYQYKITLQTMAEELYLHQAYFSTIFKNETGENFIDYVNRVRVEEATKLIKNTDLKMKEVSNRVGFQSNSYFNKVFKKITGKSPLCLRKR
ncbi:putative response regulatory protein [Paraliobacillus sp. PM-2]|uniref:response regulator n=1 Tax=Paraliobacillus sp. PM-2 TaxID=1462524 RepID=UPI00061BFCC0|nr:response regulator [Paraliobacillus sp. PM-2]CQR47175.1 putative response regulatory protein [Paraliobacillus sp. PM-2]